MDLSSLEGPPIPDTRFSSPTSITTGVPHIRLEDAFSPVSPLSSNSWGLPPRPASTSAVDPRSKYPNTGSNGFRQSIHPNDNNNNRANFRTPPNQSLRPVSPHGVSHSTSTLSPSSRSSRPHSNSVSAPHQLVWVESEQIWILTAKMTPSPTRHQRSRSSRSNPDQTGGTRSLLHTRSMNLYPSPNYLEDTDPDDLPPPYEEHVFDQPLGPILPAVTRVRPEETPHRGSQWAAVGRRVS